LVAALALAGCGYHPLYGSAENGSVVQSLASVAIPELHSREGQLVRNDLLSAIRPVGTGEKERYRLDLSPTLEKQSVIARTTSNAGRSSLRLTVAYTLVDRASGSTVTSGKVFSKVSYDVVRQPISDIQAENNATERAAHEVAADIRTRLAAYFAAGQGA
jgi:LPS-assembly lipoprotein